jgi:prepilin-type processing-associated H-X9-DG protein
MFSEIQRRHVLCYCYHAGEFASGYANPLTKQEGTRMKVNAQLAFTRTELLVLLVFIMLTGAVVLPLLASNTQRADRIVCFNNLRLIAGAYHQWMTDHNDLAPWYVPVVQGGTYLHPDRDRLWFQYWWLSDELVTPRILADPADDRPFARVAHTWDNGPQGLRRPIYQNSAISYWLGIGASPIQPGSLISGDYHVWPLNWTSSSSTFLNGLRTVPPDLARWRNAVHGTQGNIAFIDGHVEEVDSGGLRRAFAAHPDWNSRLMVPPN